MQIDFTFSIGFLMWLDDFDFTKAKQTWLLILAKLLFTVMHLVHPCMMHGTGAFVVDMVVVVVEVVVVRFVVFLVVGFGAKIKSKIFPK